MAALNNRAQARLKLQQWEAAAEDCSAVLQKDPKNVKALYRRAQARYVTACTLCVCCRAACTSS